MFSTSVLLDKIEFNQTSESAVAQCVQNLYVILKQGDRLVAQNCLRTHPTWWADQMPQLSGRRLRDIAIAGTHDSAAYALSSHRLSHYIPRRMRNYILTQDESIYNQLVYGIR